MHIFKRLRNISGLVLCASIFLITSSWAGESQFSKLDAQGKPLPDDASSWAMVFDQKYNLTWEVKTTDGSIHDVNNTYSWKEAEAKFIAALNDMEFGGYADWRIPIEGEIFTIRSKKFTPYINSKFFPNTAPAPYWTFDICGDGTFIIKTIRFGKDRTKTNGKRVRAVRGDFLPQ